MNKIGTGKKISSISKKCNHGFTGTRQSCNRFLSIDAIHISKSSFPYDTYITSPETTNPEGNITRFL